MLLNPKASCISFCVRITGEKSPVRQPWAQVTGGREFGTPQMHTKHSNHSKGLHFCVTILAGTPWPLKMQASVTFVLATRAHLGTDVSCVRTLEILSKLRNTVSMKSLQECSRKECA